MSIKRRIGDFLVERPRRRKFYKTFVNKGDLVFDVGANVGNRTSVFLDLGAKVVAIEPQSHCAEMLKHKFGRDPRLTIIQKALGQNEGIGVIHTCGAETISSMSDEWINAVKSSGRFSDYNWQNEEDVQITTLDVLISRFGTPSFCKIDVEGFESKVLRGLSTPIRTISFEFTPENIDNTIDSLMKIETLGKYAYNWSLEESLQLELDDWTTSEKMIQILSKIDPPLWGDVYARRED